MRYIALKNPDKCRSCGFCDEIACSCRYVGYTDECVGCIACYLACPHEAIVMIEKPNGESVSIKLDGEIFSVRERITIKKALELSGYKSCGYPFEMIIISWKPHSK